VQQEQRPQLRTPYYNQQQQVHSLTQCTVHSDYAHPILHQQHTSNFPALPTQPESQWQKVTYKKRPTDIPDTHAQNIKQIKLHDYWLNPPPHKLQTDLTEQKMAKMEEGNEQIVNRPNIHQFL
jgi:hypothetical protein